MGRPRVKGALCILAGLHPDDILSMVRTRFFTSSAVFTTVRATGLRDLLRWISGPELSMSGPHMNLIHVSPCVRPWVAAFVHPEPSGLYPVAPRIAVVDYR